MKINKHKQTNIGPLAHTCLDFWRMVYEMNSTIIVMLANEIENGKSKVYPYYPTEGIFSNKKKKKNE